MSDEIDPPSTPDDLLKDSTPARESESNVMALFEKIIIQIEQAQSFI